jgi:glycosyltransferase involved in cell wall biosynthesis
MAPSRLSLIIPAYNEEAYLPRLLDTVDVARSRYARGPGAVEVIVADNRSTDKTAEIARARGCQVVQVEKRVIGAVRNGGVQAAQGDVLCFVDADARIHPDTFNAVDRALKTGEVVAGATGVRLERMSFGIGVTFVLMLPMIWLTGMDTGVVFCRREDFDAIGGYNERLLAAEDVRFLWDLKRLGRPRKQRLARLRSSKALASMRKFDEHGDWHYFTLFWRGLRSVLSRRSLDEFAATYWYGEQRQPDDKKKSRPG